MKWEERRVSKTSLGLQSLLLTTFKKKKEKLLWWIPKRCLSLFTVQGTALPTTYLRIQHTTSAAPSAVPKEHEARRAVHGCRDVVSLGVAETLTGETGVKKKAKFLLEPCQKVPSRRPAKHELLKKQSQGPNEKPWQAVMCHLNYKEEGKCLVLFVFFFFGSSIWWAFSHPKPHSGSFQVCCFVCVWNLLIQTKKPNQQNGDAQFLSPGAFNTAWNKSWPGGSRETPARWCS